jgi:hypothetical protein
MSFSFQKRKKVMPGVTLNFSKKGPGVRVGGKHMGVSKGVGRKATASAGLFGFRWWKRF